MYSRGVLAFGADVVTDVMTKFIAAHGPTVISVGSGVGGIEHTISSACTVNWLLVDPSPLSYAKRGVDAIIIMPPTHADISELDRSHIGTTPLFLNWCLPNDSQYDYDAIVTLNPPAFVTIYEIFNGSNGAAGGEKFFNFINRPGCPYYLTQEWVVVTDTGRADLDIRLGWYVRRDLVKDVKQTQVTEVTSKTSLEQACCVM
jgi:hypothetical protein